MIKLNMYEHFGGFCADGEKAKTFFDDYIKEAIDSNMNIIIDFCNVKNMNSSFANVLFSSIVIYGGNKILDRIKIINCRDNIVVLISSAFEDGLRKINN